MISYDLRGKAALVTGAASGVGFATARMLLKSGAVVALNFLPDDARGPQAVAELREVGKVIAAPGNVGDPASTERMISNALSALGGMDLLVNNAGTPGVRESIPPARLDLMTEELWKLLLEVNLLGVFRCSKTAASALKASKGAIVNVATVAAFDLRGSSMGYAAAKAGVVSLTKNLARALSPEVRVNAVAPGFINSPWMPWPEETLRAGVEKPLLRRIAEPVDIADLIVYLGFGANMVTGVTVPVDGGLTIAS
ncbi:MULTISPECIES: SDR family oxidoreductase [unclassified Bradyrhizobium]|uniref:SDR family NAD(P)-dependent oxidoreductase n=1 Tax=unclassified Bradyrhizobium TaxID=2631580 RepID=UPI001FFAF747|nr:MULTISPECIES: SDR family oxidoreductase [unclassified Bradyrhizobium]MCK1614607.1 SDR family oxidoreductase [Bradyrhizobium sp. 163]MCK1764004.1 SDR family oxidoreductase [Bradyrhizobium sp. 136]